MAALTNNQRIDARSRLIPVITGIISDLSLASLTDKALAASLPFAHIARPEQLFDDPHLNAGGYLLDTVMPDGTTAKLPAMPLSLGGRVAGLKNSPPQLGAHTEICLAGLGFTGAEISQFDDDVFSSLLHPMGKARHQVCHHLSQIWVVGVSSKKYLRLAAINSGS